ncbi:MAG: preprotein translocase subunit YajC [Spirochaetia bacterium]|nr:preprotein translocase subunit YajC [Spirochaetia bacterium]
MKNESFIISQVVSSGEATTGAQAPAGTPQAPEGMPQQGSTMSLLFFPLMILVFYFLLIRPQQKKEKQKREMIKTLSKGDKVITRGGIWGVVVGIKNENNIAVVKIADNVKIEVSIDAIEAANPKPASGAGEIKNAKDKPKK